MNGGRKKILIVAGKIAVGLLLSWVLINRLRDSAAEFDVSEMWRTLGEKRNLLLVICCIVLMPLNWILETFKWKMIIDTVFDEFTFRTAFKSVFSGVAFGNLAPGRATEFAGKILFIPKRHRAEASYLHFVSGASQLLMTMLAGLIVILFKGVPRESGVMLSVITYAVIPVIFAMALIFYLNPSWIFERLKKLKFMKRLSDGEISVKKAVLLKIFLLSALRYIVFAGQFLLIAAIFFREKDIFLFVPGVCMYYLFSSVVPMFSVMEPFMRGGIAVIVFDGVENNSMNVFITSTAIWIINIVLPSILGYVFFLLRKSAHTVR